MGGNAECQFGGADFVRSYNESAKASATFLTAVDLMGQDIASRAYVQSSGPFAGRAKNLAPPLSLTAPDDAYKTQITRLYQRMLFRDPTPEEIDSAFRFIRNVAKAENQLALQPQGGVHPDIAPADDEDATAVRSPGYRLRHSSTVPSRSRR